jgi:hypothetical protein
MSIVPADAAVAPEKGSRPDKPPLPWPTCRFRENPVRWTVNKAQELLISIPFGHVFLLAWVAIYYILTQTPVLNPVVHLFGYQGNTKQWWDTLLSGHAHVLSSHSWKTWRHMFRSGGEAYLGTLTVLFFTFNPYKYEFKRLHAYWQIPVRVLVALVVAIPLFVILGLLMHEVQHWLHTGALAPAIGRHPNVAQKLYSDTWTTKLVVILAALIGRRPMFGVFEFVMRRFAERRVAAGKAAHWWQTAPYRAMVLELHQEEGQAVVKARRDERSTTMGWLVGGFIAAVLGLAGYGFYIIDQFAKS